MAQLSVVDVIDGDTFVVSPQWNRQGHSGGHVRRTGYDAPDYEPGRSTAKRKLANFVLNKQVDLRTAYRVDRGRLVCDVYFQGKNLADYFPEYKVSEVFLLCRGISRDGQGDKIFDSHL